MFRSVTECEVWSMKKAIWPRSRSNIEDLVCIPIFVQNLAGFVWMKGLEDKRTGPQQFREMRDDGVGARARPAPADRYAGAGWCHTARRRRATLPDVSDGVIGGGRRGAVPPSIVCVFLSSCFFSARACVCVSVCVCVSAAAGVIALAPRRIAPPPPPPPWIDLSWVGLLGDVGTRIHRVVAWRPGPKNLRRIPSQVSHFFVSSPPPPKKRITPHFGVGEGEVCLQLWACVSPVVHICSWRFVFWDSGGLTRSGGISPFTFFPPSYVQLRPEWCLSYVFQTVSSGIVLAFWGFLCDIIHFYIFGVLGMLYNSSDQRYSWVPYLPLSHLEILGDPQDLWCLVFSWYLCLCYRLIALEVFFQVWR